MYSHSQASLKNDEGESILTPIIFFDCFEYPLTASEVWKWQYQQATGDRPQVTGYGAVVEALEALEQKGVIESGNGFWFLKGRSELIKIRNRRHGIAYKKWRRALRMIRILRHFPFVRFIGVANTLAYDNADAESDIDLFIITSANRAWSARFFVTTFLKLFNLRPNPRTRKDKICCCFWVDETAMNLESLSLEKIQVSMNKFQTISNQQNANEAAETAEAGPLAPASAARGPASIDADIYLHYWLATLWPVWDPAEMYEQFFAANAWAWETLPNVRMIEPNRFRRTDITPTSSPLKRGRGAEYIASCVPEAFLRLLQERKFPASIRTQMNRNTNVVVNDHVLKFHVDDRREEVRKKVAETLSRITDSSSLRRQGSSVNG